jgi:hypothetical protein
VAKRKQFSIRFLLAVTVMVAVWFGLYRIEPHVAVSLFAPMLITAMSVIRWTLRPLIWLPLAGTLNWIALGIFGWLGPAVWLGPPNEPLHVYALGILWLIAVSAFTIDSTVTRYRSATSRNYVVLVALGYCVLAGAIVGLMVGIPLELTNLLQIDGVTYWVPQKFGISVVFSIGGAITCSFLGIWLGLLCDAIIAREFARRPKRHSREMEGLELPLTPKTLND